MATLWLTGGTLEFGWKATGITSTIESFGITEQEISEGQTSRPNLISYSSSAPMNSYKWVNARPGTYNLYLVCKNEDTKKWYTKDYNSVTVEDEEDLPIPGTPTDFSFSTTLTSIQVYCSCKDASYINVYCSEINETKEIDGSSGSVTFSNLDQGREYNFSVRGYNEDKEGGDKVTESASTDLLDKFSFSKSIAPGEPFTNLTTSDWNDLMYCLELAAKYRLNDESWRGTRFKGGDKFTRDAVQRAINLCNRLPNTSGLGLYADNKVYAAYLNNIASSYNNNRGY